MTGPGRRSLRSRVRRARVRALRVRAWAYRSRAMSERQAELSSGIQLHVVEEGEGPLVVLCHGFPELAFSWRHQIPALAEAGFRVVAPDMRGYGGSSAPADVEAYDIVSLCGDLCGLLD